MKIVVKTDNNINKSQLTIRLNGGLGWHTIIHSLYEGEKANTNTFIKEAGIFTLLITYKNFFYQEIVLYRMKPELES